MIRAVNINAHLCTRCESLYSIPVFDNVQAYCVVSWFCTGMSVVQYAVSGPVTASIQCVMLQQLLRHRHVMVLTRECIACRLTEGPCQHGCDTPAELNLDDAPTGLHLRQHHPGSPSRSVSMNYLGPNRCCWQNHSLGDVRLTDCMAPTHPEPLHELLRLMRRGCGVPVLSAPGQLRGSHLQPHGARTAGPRCGALRGGRAAGRREVGDEVRTCTS